MVKCEYCGTEMTDDHTGCRHSHFVIDGKWVRRRLVDEDEAIDGHCCDCGAPVGTFHHPGCDQERCPVCGLQSITCDCNVTEVGYEED